MSLVVTSNMNISVDLVVTTTMSLVVQSNVNISIAQALAYYYVTCRKPGLYASPSACLAVGVAVEGENRMAPLETTESLLTQDEQH